MSSGHQSHRRANHQQSTQSFGWISKKYHVAVLMFQRPRFVFASKTREIAASIVTVDRVNHVPTEDEPFDKPHAAVDDDHPCVTKLARASYGFVDRVTYLSRRRFSGLFDDRVPCPVTHGQTCFGVRVRPR